MTLRRLGQLGIGVALALIGASLALGLIEAGIRLYRRAYPSEASGFFWSRNAAWGWGLTPGRDGVVADTYGGQFRVHVRINSLGLHDVEHRYAKDPATFRILVLGDSYIEALQVDLEQTFGRQLEQRLRARLGRPVEVVSAGVSSWGTDNELLWFRHEGYKYRPDLVLLAFTTTNDVRESYAPYNRLDPWANLSKPSFVVSDTGALEMRPGPEVPALPWWRQLYVGDFLYRRLGGKVVVPHRGQNAAPLPQDPELTRVPADMLVHAPVYPPQVAEAWRVTEALIRTLRAEAAAHGAKFAVMVHGGPWVHHLDRWRLMFARAGIAAARTWDRRKPSRLIDDFLTREQIPFIDLFDAFESAKRNEPLFFRVNIHWTPAGHRVAAETAAEFLVARHLVP
jgi:hypothetical protein